MTNKEAAEVIKVARAEVEWEYPIEYAAAFDKAIEELEQETCEDAISRDDAIRIAEQGQVQGFEWEVRKLLALPSVNPQPKTGHREDAISRKDAILQIQRYGVGCFDAEEFSPEECERFVINKLNVLPPVYLQEPKTGHWIDKSKQSYCGVKFIHIECSECGEVSGLNNTYARYCPWCGAKMVKSEEV